MRVLHVLGYYYPATEWGGPIRSCHLLCKALLADGVEVEVVTTNQRGESGLRKPQAGRTEVEGVGVRYTSAFPPRRYFFAPSLVGEIAKAMSRVDLVHVQGLWTFPTLVAPRLARYFKKPFVLSPRGSLDPWALGYRRLKKAGYLAAFEASTLKRAAAIHFTTAAERDLAPEWVPRGTAHVVPNVVEMPSCESASLQSSTFLYVGRLHPMKGIDIAIRAFSMHRRASPEARLVVAGGSEGGYRVELEKLCSRLGVGASVRFTGEVDRRELEAHYRSARALLLPSHRENFGNVVAEAMAAGLPVVVSKHVNLEADIRESGAGIVTGLDAAEVARAMNEIGSDLATARRMGDAGARLVRERFCATSVAQAMKQVYNAALRH